MEANGWICFVKAEPESENSCIRSASEQVKRKFNSGRIKSGCKKDGKNFCAGFVRAEFGIGKNSLKV